jgi:hypothetical protein
MEKVIIARAASIGAALALSACGTFVPEIQEFPGSATTGQLLVQAIIHSVHCEIKNAVIEVLGKKGVKLDATYQEGAFMNNWGALVALTLTVNEKSELNPTAVWTPLKPMSAMFTLGGGLDLSSQATRTDIVNFFYTIDSIRRGNRCQNPVSGPPGSFLVQSDLKLREWLYDEIMAVGTLEIGAPNGPNSILKQNVISHEVKFEVVTSGNITPAWKLIESTVNQGGTLFSASRDRTHDLLITLGPIDPSQSSGGLIPVAQSTHFSSLYGLAASNNLRAITRP